MTNNCIKPVDPRLTQYGIDPAALKRRAVNLEGMTSVKISELFPSMPSPVYPGEDISVIKRLTREALEGLNWDKIKPGDSVNVLGSSHGFTLFGGEPYAEMLKTIRDVIEEKTGVTNIRLRVGVGLRFKEGDEAIKRFKLDYHFQGKAAGIAPVDEPLAVDTEIGQMYVLKKAYDADWIIHAHNNDIREAHYHRILDRTYKPFAMSYARIETRSAYHHNLGPRGGSIVGRAIFESDLVQQKFLGSCILRTAPNGVMGIDVSDDFEAQNKRLTVEILQYYGKVIRLFHHIDKCIVILDCPAPIPYVHTAGIIFANVVTSSIDTFDLDNILPPYSMFTEMSYDREGKPLLANITPANPAIKAVINNYSLKGYPSAFFASQMPTIVVGPEMVELYRQCEQNMEYMDHALQADSLESAVKFSKNIADTDKIIAFDGATGGMNVSASMREFLLEKASYVNKEVEETLMPKWLSQRNLSTER